MTVTADLERDLVQATGRTAVYSLLASGFMLPTEDRLQVLSTLLVPAASRLELPAPVAGPLRRLKEASDASCDRLRLAYMELFPPIASQDAPGYETGYRGDGVFQQSAIMADISGFYRAHGLRSGGSARERPDHITVELEFMAFVARKEALALAEGSWDNAAICRETAASFLRDHLGCWASAFGLRANIVSTSPWYQALGEMLAAWVAWELASLAIQPVEVVDHPLPQEPPDDGSCGPCPVPIGGGS